jgi:hypothetical protein
MIDIERIEVDVGQLQEISLADQAAKMQVSGRNRLGLVEKAIR